MFAFIKLYEISWNENEIDINLLITQFVLRFFLYLPGSSQTDVQANIKSLVS